MIKRTKKEIADEIKALKELKPRVPRRTFFGEDNWLKIDAQLDTLEEVRDEEEVYDHYEENEDASSDDEHVVRDSALDAARWLAGDNDDKPSDGWRSIAR
jgi:hypothetical protein